MNLYFRIKKLKYMKTKLITNFNIDNIDKYQKAVNIYNEYKRKRNIIY